MGSFYSTCSVTGMSLTNQKVVRLLLVPSALCYKDWHDDKSPISYDSRNVFKGKGLIVSNAGAQAVFSPFGFPIRGVYYDYGEIDEIERDRNIEMLEDYFGLSINQIFTAASDDRWYKYGIERPKECLKKIEQAKADLADSLAWYDNEDNVDINGTLTEVREKQEALRELEKKYHYDIFDSPKSWKLSENEPKHLDVLLRLTYTDIRAEIYDFLVDKQSLSKDWWMKHLKEEVDKYFRKMEERKELKKKDDVFSKTMLKLSLGDARSFIPSLCKDNFLHIFEIGIEWEKEYWNLYYFLLSLGGLYKILLPPNYGSQENNFDLLTALNRKANALMREDKKSR